MSAAAVLTILKNGETIRTCPIEGEAVLGRGDGCVIRLEDRAISRQHAVFRVVGEGVQVEKKSEFAPLMVNGAECTSAIVKEADVISIGPYLMRVSLEKGAAKQEAAPLAETKALEPTLPPEQSVDAGLPVEVEAQAVVAEPAVEADPFAVAPTDEGAMGSLQLQPMEGLDLQPQEAQPEQQPMEGQIEAPAISLEAPEEIEHADEDAKTKLTPAAKIDVRLIFAPGAANVTEYEFTKDEISIGRGKVCDIVLNDKKSSRKNTIIRRAGLSFSIKDLESANGTFVNGARVQEQELSGDDVIRIGDVEFKFKVMSAGYAAAEAGFMPVPVDEEPPLDPSPFETPVITDLAAPMEAPADPLALGAAPAGATAAGLGGIPGITGIGPADVKRMGFVEKLKNFKTLPKKQKYYVILMTGALIYFALDFMFEEEQPAKKAPPKKAAATATAEKAPPTFESLSPEQKRFVESQHALAFDYYRNKEYDKTLYELGKIFALINDYKDSRDIERYAKEGKRKLEAFEEEKRRKEEEARLKAKIASLVEECRARMDAKQYEQAREIFAEISVLDPDNPQVAEWKKQLEDYEEKKRLDAQSKQVQEQINARAWEVYNEGLVLKKQGRYRAAMGVFAKVPDIGASDKTVLALAAKQIAICRAAIAGLRDPILEEAKKQEEAGELPEAFKLYEKATKIDPYHPAGHAGMARIRGVLHERARIVYSEAILAESYSDFATAKRKFKECRDIAPKDDVYYERALRKLQRYFRKEDST